MKSRTVLFALLAGAILAGCSGIDVTTDFNREWNFSPYKTYDWVVVKSPSLRDPLLETPMLELVGSDQQRAFGLAKRDTLPQFCLDCDVRFACHGGCPKNRFIETPDSEPGLNDLCAGYKAFFQYVDQPMRTMAELLRRNRAPAEIMQMQSTEGER